MVCILTNLGLLGRGIITEQHKNEEKDEARKKVYLKKSKIGKA